MILIFDMLFSVLVSIIIALIGSAPTIAYRYLIDLGVAYAILVLMFLLVLANYKIFSWKKKGLSRGFEEESNAPSCDSFHGWSNFILILFFRVVRAFRGGK